MFLRISKERESMGVSKKQGNSPHFGLYQKRYEKGDPKKLPLEESPLVGSALVPFLLAATRTAIPPTATPTTAIPPTEIPATAIPTTTTPLFPLYTIRSPLTSNLERYKF